MNIQKYIGIDNNYSRTKPNLKQDNVIHNGIAELFILSLWSGEHKRTWFQNSLDRLMEDQFAAGGINHLIQ